MLNRTEVLIVVGFLVIGIAAVIATGNYGLSLIAVGGIFAAGLSSIIRHQRDRRHSAVTGR